MLNASGHCICELRRFIGIPYLLFDPILAATQNGDIQQDNVQKTDVRHIYTTGLTKDIILVDKYEIGMTLDNYV